MGKQWKQWQTLFWGGSKITVDGDCSHEIKRRLLFGRKVMTNLDSILKSRDITLPTKVYLVKAMVFPVVMYGCESWTVKKAEHQGLDAYHNISPNHRWSFEIRVSCFLFIHIKQYAKWLLRGQTAMFECHLCHFFLMKTWIGYLT